MEAPVPADRVSRHIPLRLEGGQDLTGVSWGRFQNKDRCWTQWTWARVPETRSERWWAQGFCTFTVTGFDSSRRRSLHSTWAFRLQHLGPVPDAEAMGRGKTRLFHPQWWPVSISRLSSGGLGAIVLWASLHLYSHRCWASAIATRDTGNPKGVQTSMKKQTKFKITLVLTMPHGIVNI